MTREKFRAAAQIWRQEMGGEPIWGLMARCLKDVVDLPEFPVCFRRYLRAHQGSQSQFISLPKFAATMAQWRPVRESRGKRYLTADELDRQAGIPIGDVARSVMEGL